MTPEEKFEIVMSSTAANTAFIRESVLWNLARHAALEEANDNRHDQVTAGIKRAADYYLPVLQAQNTLRCHWARDLRKYLKERYRDYKLDSLPHVKTIRKNIRDWPYGHSLSD